MSSATFRYQNLPDGSSSVVREDTIESGFIGTLQRLKYEPSGARQTAVSSPKGERGGANQYRPDITNRATLEANFREKFEALNRVRLTDSEFARLLDEENRKITRLETFADVFLKKCDLGRTISRYIVLIASEQKLMIMRPYQVYAVQHMVKCIDDDNGNYDLKLLLELSTKL